jgi:hypothetical protein
MAGILISSMLVSLANCTVLAVRKSGATCRIRTDDPQFTKLML